MDEGFHYYHLTVDGGTFNDPGALNFYGSTRWESGIEIPAHDRAFYRLFSGGVITPEDVAKAEGFKDKVKVVFCSCGSKENPDGINGNHKALTEAGIENTAYVSPDTAHEFLTWRRSLKEFAPLLFQN